MTAVNVGSKRAVDIARGGGASAAVQQEAEAFRQDAARRILDVLRRRAAEDSLARKRMISVVPPMARHSIFTGLPYLAWCHLENACSNS